MFGERNLHFMCILFYAAVVFSDVDKHKNCRFISTRFYDIQMRWVRYNYKLVLINS